MKRFALATLSLLAACEHSDRAAVAEQQEHYSVAQPIPAFDSSLERGWVIQLYQLRNQRAATHTVWRSDTGIVEGDCPSLGFGIPYDTSLTNPLQSAWRHSGAAVIGQAEPNGIFASTNTSATWVMCAGDGGSLLPIYVEAKVTSYPYTVAVDYDKNRVTRAGTDAVSIPAG